MSNYKCLRAPMYENENFRLVPIRDEDKYEILEIRNQQIEHLRQSKLLTKLEQDDYFKNVIFRLFDQENPNQILFSFLQNNQFVGYGGLVHINWVDQNAEISFVMKTALQEKEFEYFWINYLSLLEKMAFQDLNFHKIFTYAFDIRPNLYIALEKAGFTKEATLTEHCLVDNQFKNVVIHSKINAHLRFRKAEKSDCKIYFDWSNDADVRQQSYHSNTILWETHQKWFLDKLQDDSCLLLLFTNNKNENIGQVRIQKSIGNIAVIGLSTAFDHRGKGHAQKMITVSCNYFLAENPTYEIHAYIKIENLSSKKAFENAGFIFIAESNHQNFMSFHFIKKLNYAN